MCGQEWFQKSSKWIGGDLVLLDTRQKRSSTLTTVPWRIMRFSRWIVWSCSFQIAALTLASCPLLCSLAPVLGTGARVQPVVAVV